MIDIDGMRVDAVGTLPYVIDINNRVQDVKILMRNLKIYNPNGALNALYRNVPNGTPPAGSRFGNIWIYGQITVPFSGLTWADVAPFVDGPIYVNDVKVADRPGGDVTLSLANNTAKSFPFTGTSIMTVSCLENTTANPTGLYVVRSSGSTVTFSPIYQEDNVTTALLTDTVLTGTTGSVGNFTMSVDTVTDRIYFENRRGVGSFRNLSITLSPWVPV